MSQTSRPTSDSTHLISRSFPLIVALLTAIPLCAPEPVHAALNKDEAQCVGKLLGNGAKVAAAQAKLQGACVKAKAQSKLIGTVDQCVTDDAQGKVQKKTQKVSTDATKYCGGGTGFVVTTDAITNNYTRYQPQELFAELFGATADPVVATDKDTAACQGKVQKALDKVVNTKVKAYRDCFKDAVKVATDLTGFETCLQGVSANSKVATAVAKLSATRGKSCDGVAFGTAFPGTCGGSPDGATLDACLDRIAECHVCHMIDGMQGLGIDCDLFDNGVADLSCSSAPPYCGDNHVDKGEACDGNNTGGLCCQPDCTQVPSASPELCYVAGDEDCDGLADTADPDPNSLCATSGTEPCTCADACLINVLVPNLGGNSLAALAPFSPATAGASVLASHTGTTYDSAGGEGYKYSFTAVPANLSLWWGMTANGPHNQWNGFVPAAPLLFTTSYPAAVPAGDLINPAVNPSAIGTSVQYFAVGPYVGSTIAFTPSGGSGTFNYMPAMINMSALSPAAQAISPPANMTLAPMIALPAAPTVFDINFAATVGGGLALNGAWSAVPLKSPNVSYGINYTAALYGSYRNANVCP